MAIVHCAVYEDGRQREEELALSDACEAGQGPGSFTWLDLFEPPPGEFEAVRQEFNLHPLAVEDALSAHQRPKLERYGDTLFLVLKTLSAEERPGDRHHVRVGEVMVFAGEGFLVTVRHGAGTELDTARERSDRELLARGATGGLYAVVDQVVDEYEPIVRGFEQQVADVEELIFAELARVDPTPRLYALGREVLRLQRAISPLLEPAAELVSGRVPGIDDALRTYFRDIQDHLVRMKSALDALNELLQTLLQANLAQVTVRQNEDVRKISAWVAIVAVPTMVAGIYGMNFEHMPELSWRFGYPAVLLVMVTICAALYLRFRRAGWL